MRRTMTTQESSTIVREIIATAQADIEKHIFNNALGVHLWKKQREILQAVMDGKRRIAVRSGNSLGKTYFISRLGLAILMAFPGSIVINTAPTHRQVENQYWRNLRTAYNRAIGKIGGRLKKTQLSFDEDWFAIGFSPKKGEGGMESFQGWHGKKIVIIVDEASGVSREVFEAIEGAMAGGQATLILIGNPTKPSGDFAEAFKDPNYHKIHISAFDSPNVKAGEIIVEGLATREWVDEMRAKYGEDSDQWRVRVLGDFPQNDDEVMIPIGMVTDAIDAEREEYGDDEWIGLDPARFGNDKAAFVRRKGNYAHVLEVYDKSSTMFLAGRAVQLLKKYPNANLNIDTIGVGAGVYDRLMELPEVSYRVHGTNVAMAAKNKEDYANLRAEGWGLAKAWLKDGILENHEGWYELAQPKFTYTSKGQIQIESKEDMKKRGVQSPNIADAFILTLIKPTSALVLPQSI